MEEVLATSAEQARKTGDSHNTHDFDGPPKHISLNKTLIRKKSVFKLAAEFFKPKKDEFPTLEHEKRGKTRLPWNTFASLRGPRESKKRPSIFGAARCRSSSPQKSDDIATDEFGVPKTMRRKSLQDLLGTVGTKFSLVRRHAYSDDSIPQIEAPLEAMTEFQDVSTLVLPEPAIPLSEPSAPVLNSLCHYPTDSTSNEARSSRGNPKSHRGGEEDPAGRSKLRTKPSFHIIHAAAQPTNPIDRQSPSKTHRKSQELQQIPSSPSSGMLCLTAPAHHLRDISPQVPVRVRFVDEKDAPQYRYSDDFEDTIAPENENLDPAFLGRAINREARYNSISGGLNSEQTESVAEDTGKQDNFTAANILRNLHLSTSQSRWSADSSETGTDDTSDYDWVEKEVEVQDIIDRGKEIMTLGTLSPYLHSSSMGNFLTRRSSANPVEDNKIHVMAPEGTRLDENPSQLRGGAFSPHHYPHVYVQECLNPKEDWMSSASYVMRPMISDEQELVLPSSGNLTMTDDELQRSCELSQGRRQMISLQNGERFRPRALDSHIIPGEPVHIVYPPSEICAGHTKTYLSKSRAFEDLYHNHSGFSDFCLFDRRTRTYYPQAFSDPIPELIQTNAEMLEVLWLPLEMFPADTLTGQFDKEDDWLSPVGGLVSVASGQLCYKTVGLPNLDSSSLQTSDFNNSERSFNNVENTASISSPHDSACSEQGSGEGCNESTPHIDVVGMSSSNYTVTLISTREVPSLTTRSVISNDPQIEVDDMDDSYEIAVDPTSARRYLGSSFSSTESLQSIVEAGVTHSKSIDSILHELKDWQPEDAKHVKTWVEMEREFLEKFAPGSQMYPDRGRGIAVYEAFRKLQGLANASDDDRLRSSDSAALTENEKWVRYKKSYMEFSFENIDDIVASGSTNEERSATANSSCVRESSNQSPSADANIIFNAGDKGEESVKVTNRAHTPPVQIASFRNRLRDTLVEEQAADLELSIAEGMSNKINLGTGRTDGGRELSIVPLGNQSRVGSEVYSDTDSTAITMLSGYMFTHYAEQLGECHHDEEQPRCEEEEEEQLGDRSTRAAFSDPTTHVAPKIRDNNMPMPTEGLKTDTGLEIDTDQLNICPKNENVGLTKVMTAQLCPPPIRVGLSPQLTECSTSLDTSRLNSTETSNGPITSGSRFLTRNRTMSPKIRIPSPLTNFSLQKIQTFRCASPSPSETDTEVSENFGQKLKRYKHVEEEDKENDLWWKDSISYG